VSDLVVDTNVAVVANDARFDLDDPRRRPTECIEACVDVLLELTRAGRLVIDDGGEIFAQYSTYLSRAGQPGAGDIFMKWVHDNQWQEDLVVRVRVTPDANRGYAEFPDDSNLKDFDWDDRVFVAVVVACDEWPRIQQAVDYKWHRWAEALEANGVHVDFLCG
jgi:hypothetical protein